MPAPAAIHRSPGFWNAPARTDAIRDVFAALDPAHQIGDALGRLLAQIARVHPAKFFGNRPHRLRAQAHDIAWDYAVTIAVLH